MIYLGLAVLLGLLSIAIAIHNAKPKATLKTDNTYVVYYKPPLSKECIETIHRNIQHSKNSGDTYIFKIERIFVIAEMLPTNDLILLRNLEKRGIDYIEVI